MQDLKPRLLAGIGLAAATALSLAACSQEQPPKQAATPSEWRLYVTNERSGDLTVIDQPSNKVVATVPLGKRPRGLHLSPDGKTLFVALSGSPIAGPGVDESKLPPADKGADGIGVFDTATMKLVKVLRGVSDPEQVTVSDDGQRMYIASEDTGTLVVWDADGKLVATIPAGGEPEGVAISPDGKSVYVSSEEDNKITVVDTVQQKAIAEIPVGKRPRTIAFTRGGGVAYVPGEIDGSVSVIDTNTHKVIGMIKLDGEDARPMGSVVSPDGKIVYVSTGRGGTLISIDAATRKPLKHEAVGERPWGIAVSPNGRFVYTANGPSNDVSVVETQNLKVVTRIPAGTGPWGVAAGPKP